MISGDHVTRFIEEGLWQGEQELLMPNSVGFEHDGKLYAGLAYHNYSPDEGHIEVSAYSERRDWLTKGRLKYLLYTYPFEELGLRLIIARHSATNKTARRLWTRLGAAEHELPDLRAEGESEIVAILKRETAKKMKWTD